MESTRNMERRIYRALLCASDQEISDGLAFYPGAHGLCRLFALSHPPLTVKSVAGIYAALSPMNTWDTNVANIVAVLRDGTAASVNTTDINLHKACTILSGVDPEVALSGRKVKSFYRSIACYDDYSTPPAIDRHLINLALGIIPNKNTQSALASDDDLYTRVESVYVSMGKRADLHSLGNRLASIAWFVQRRISRDRQIPLLYPSRAVCCNTPSHSHGARKYRCPVCRTTRNKIVSNVADGVRNSPPIVLDLDHPIHGALSAFYVNGYPAVYLRKSHPLANSAGWQYAARAVVMQATGERLHRSENVHHSDGNKLNCQRNNLEVWLEQKHGKYHADRQLMYMLRDRITGRFLNKLDTQFNDGVPF